MKHPFALLLGCGLTLVGLFLWHIANKHEKPFQRAYWQTVFMGNTLLLMGLSYLISSGWIPGGKSVSSWLDIGVGASAIPGLYIYFLNWCDRKLQKNKQPSEDKPEPLRVPNR